MSDLSPAIYDFISKNGGRVRNKQLIAEFRKSIKAEGTDHFKKEVAKVAKVKEENGEKWVILRKPKTPDSDDWSSDLLAQVDQMLSNTQHQIDQMLDNRGSPEHVAMETETNHAEVEPEQEVPCSMPKDPSFELPPPEPPVRGLDLNREPSESADFPTPPDLAYDSSNHTSPPHSEPIMEEDFPTSQSEDANPPPTDQSDNQSTSVKERAAVYNKIVSSTDISEGKDAEDDSGHQRRQHHSERATLMDNLDKEWLQLCCQCYVKEKMFKMLKMLSEHPHLALRRDFITGMTCLHWAAKHGIAEAVKIVAGNYKADINAKTNGGYTALHLAALHDRTEVYQLLVHTYGANVDIRDYRGKKASFYLHDKPKLPGPYKHSDTRASVLRCWAVEFAQKYNIPVRPGPGGAADGLAQGGQNNRGSVILPPQSAFERQGSFRNEGRRTASPRDWWKRASHKNNNNNESGKMHFTTKSLDAATQLMPPPSMVPPPRRTNRYNSVIEEVNPDPSAGNDGGKSAVSLRNSSEI